MSKEEKPKIPKCHFCGEEIAEGFKLKTKQSEKNVVICFDCTDIIAAVAHDFASGIIADIDQIMNDPPKTWKEELEIWQIKEDPTE